MKQRDHSDGTSRRSFLGGSVAATVAAVALPQLALAGKASSAFPIAASEDSEIAFLSGKPIWPRGKDKEMNLFVGFRAVFEAPPRKRVYVRAAGATLYRIFVNGKFDASGPARGPHGFYRVDLFEITPLLQPGRNWVCFEVAGYNVNSYYVLDQPSFLQAEVATESEALAWTGGTGRRAFEAAILTERLQKVQRYSFQRSFSEVYRMSAESSRWRHDPESAMDACPCTTSEPRKLIVRRVPQPNYYQRQPELIASEGTFKWGANGPRSLAEDRSVPFGAKISKTLHGFPESELTVIPYLELQKTESVVNSRVDEPYVWENSIQLNQNEFRIFDFGTNITGFFGARVTVHEPTKLYFTFDETLMKGDVDFTRLMCVNIVAYTLEPGVYELETFEPYVMRFLKPMVLEGACKIDRVHLREYTAPDVWTGDFHSGDDGLNVLFTAGRETYRPNAVDFFTDTPSRERAGWLCDSYFTGQVAPLLSGNTVVEKCYLENYMLPDHFDYIPKGMIPMCYPADSFDGNFTPNWALWFLLQLQEYLGRSGDKELVDSLRQRVIGILTYFKPFENEFGLLEKLQGIVFVEWSKANDYLKDVNYPTNMLYAAALEAVGRTYDMPDRIKQADAIREVIRSQSYDGAFFVDNAIRQGGKLVPTHNRSETCQYYAFYFGTATRDRYPKLWETLHTEFGPQRHTTGAFPEIAPSNALIGNVMRRDLLGDAGLTAQLIQESKTDLLYQAELTGTFWENSSNEASMNHAFGSYIVAVLYRDILGLHRIDPLGKQVHLRFTETPLTDCQGRVPTADGFVTLRWSKTADAVIYQLDVPAGYAVTVENLGSIKVQARRFPRGNVNFGIKVEGGYK